MTKKERAVRLLKFEHQGATLLTLCKMDALDLGLLKTARAIDLATKAIGWDLAALRKAKYTRKNKEHTQ
jgi:hypothetical protein